MLALRTSRPILTAAEAERIARDLYGLAVSAHALPGERDANFHLRAADAQEWVLKIASLEDAAGTDCLVKALDHLAEQGEQLPVPRLIPTLRGQATGRELRQGTEYSTCLVSFLTGRLLSDSTTEPPVLERVGTAIATLDRALRGFFHPALERALAWDVRRLPELSIHAALIADQATRSAVDVVTAAMHAALPRLRSLRSQAIHGDCHPGNVLLSAGIVSGFVDFGDMIHAPLVVEPAVAMSELLTESGASWEGLEALLAGYARGGDLGAADIEALFDVITARHAVTLLVHAYRRAYDPEGASELASAAERAAPSLERLLSAGREALSRRWHAAAGTASAPRDALAGGGVELARRHRLMGRGAELFYEQPLHLVRGEGVWLFDAAGHAYLDVYNNVAQVGHAHPHVVAAIQRQSALLATHSRYLHAGILDYAQRLTDRLPAHLDACIFVNSGSEANDVAWRLAQLASGGSGAVVMQNAYHGVTHATAALTPSKGEARDAHVVTLRAPTPALYVYEGRDPAGIAAARADAAAALARLRERDHAPAAFYLDTAITSSGVFDPPPEWGDAVTEDLRKAGALIIADEVQYGLGRPGSHFWGFERRGIEPDIVTLGKPVANGYPMGVVVANRRLIEALQGSFGFFSTFGGNAVAAAAANAVLEVLEREALMENAAAVGKYLRQGLDSLAGREPSLGQVRGHGLLLGLQVRAADASGAQRATKRIINALARDRILIGYEGPNADILKLRPPLPFAREHADRLIEGIERAVRGLA